MPEKVCFRCGRRLPLTRFYHHPQMRDGHLNKCTDCTRADTLANRTLRADYYRDYDKRRYYEGRHSVPKDRQAARNAARTVPRQPCEVCGDPKTQRHHPDYTKPKKVRHLCRKHHAEAHRIYA